MIITKKKLNININISVNTNMETADKYTQTEEIYFKNNWRNFIGMCKIMTPKINKYPIFRIIHSYWLNLS